MYLYIYIYKYIYRDTSPEGSLNIGGRNSFLCLETTKGIYVYFNNMKEKPLNNVDDTYGENTSDRFCSVILIFTRHLFYLLF